MANLLVPSARAKLRRAVRSRFLFAGALAVSGAALVSLVCLAPAYVALRMSGSAAGSSAPAAVPGRASAIADDEMLIALLRPFESGTTTPVQALALALSLRPGGVSVDHLQYARSGGQIVIGGTSKDPSLVESYRAALAKQPIFASASVPLGSLVGANNGRFVITVTGIF